MNYEFYFTYDSSWSDMEILELLQIIQRILNVPECQSFTRTELVGFVTIPVNVNSHAQMDRLLSKIKEKVIMVAPYVLGYREV